MRNSSQLLHVVCERQSAVDDNSEACDDVRRLDVSIGQSDRPAVYFR